MANKMLAAGFRLGITCLHLPSLKKVALILTTLVSQSMTLSSLAETAFIPHSRLSCNGTGYAGLNMGMVLVSVRQKSLWLIDTH